LETRWLLSDNEKFQPYAGLGLSISITKFEDRDAGVETGWKVAPGGCVIQGADINKWPNLYASYNLMSDVEGYNFSGFLSGRKYRFISESGFQGNRLTQMTLQTSDIDKTILIR
jgi:hypothetical protein